MKYTAKDLITEDNVVETYAQGRYICFVLKNGIRVKLNPNQVTVKGNGAEKGVR